MADTIHTQPELTGELSTEELLKALKLAIDSFPPAHPDAEGMSVAQYEVTLELRKARAAIAADRARRQPVPGEVQELVKRLRHASDEADAMGWEQDSWLIGCAAELLSHRYPQPVAIPGEEYHEDMGAVTWWRLPVEEPPWVGTPNDSDWPGYHTHFTPAPPEPCNANDHP